MTNDWKSSPCFLPEECRVARSNPPPETSTSFWGNDGQRISHLAPQFWAGGCLSKLLTGASGGVIEHRGSDVCRSRACRYARTEVCSALSSSLSNRYSFSSTSWKGRSFSAMSAPHRLPKRRWGAGMDQARERINGPVPHGSCGGTQSQAIPQLCWHVCGSELKPHSAQTPAGSWHAIARRGGAHSRGGRPGCCAAAGRGR